MNRIVRWSLASLLIVTLLLVGAIIVYFALNPTAQPDPDALAALNSDSQVTVTQDQWLTFMPQEGEPHTGFILYPGGLVDPRAYAPIARQIAASGYLVVIPSMPLDLAVLGANRASDIIDAYPDVERWAIGGHSLGGAMAAQYAANNPDAIDALILWAAYPPQGADLSEHNLVATSISGTRDGLVSQSEIEDSLNRLPPKTRIVVIEGGNHAQFGSYGPQDGDLPAEISAAEQQAQIADATIAVLEQIE